MITAQEIEAAGNYVEQLRQSVHDHSLPNTDRVRAAGSCLAIAQEHHHAIILLIKERLFAPAFALVRAVFEAYVRGEWLAHCASDSMISRFLMGREPPKVDELLDALEETPSFAEKVLSRIKQRGWKAMCGYSHTGGLHVQRWNTDSGIESNFSRDEIIEVMRFADSIGTLAVVGLAHLAQDDDLAIRTFDAYKKRMSA
jgi:hypothetical protein